jgi:uncharacterized membrane protein
MPDASGTPNRARPWRKILAWSVGLLLGVTAVFYPLVVYSLLTSDGNTTPTWRLAWLLVPLGLSLVSALRARGPWFRRVLPPLAALILVLFALTLNTLQPLLLVPVVINGTLLVTFGSTLFRGPPLIERFARLQHPDLTPAEVSWCRAWTKVWTGFFATNAVVATTLGLANRLELWALYNGLLTYIVMGGFFVGEYSVRKYRFGRYDAHPLDRLLRWCFARGHATPRDDTTR